MAGLISRGFLGRRRPAEVEDRLPPGQYLVTDFPVLSAGPTPHTPLDRWSFSMEGLVKSPVTWSWQEFQKLPTQTFTVDISCVTKWTKLDTKWLAVTVDTLLQAVQGDPAARYGMAFRAGVNTHGAHGRDGHQQSVHRLSVRRQPTGPWARGAGPPGRPPPLFLEERQVG